MFSFEEPKFKGMSLDGGLENYRPPGSRLNQQSSPAGRKVVFHPENGRDMERANAEQLFAPGTILTVQEIEVGRSASLVEFQEYPDKWFNTVMFGDI